VKQFFFTPRYRLALKVDNSGEFGDGLRHILPLARHFCAGTGIDVGASFFKNKCNPLPGSTPVDVCIPGSGSACDLSRFQDGSLDFVFFSHTIEHVDDPEKAAAESFRVIRPGGVYFLYCPFPGHKDWDPLLNHAVRVEHKWQPDPTSVQRLLVLGGFRILYAEHFQDYLWSFVTIGKKPAVQL